VRTLVSYEQLMRQFGRQVVVRIGEGPQRSSVVARARGSELRKDRSEQSHNLARMCCRWADDVADVIGDHDPDMGGLINRVADNWRPLFAIADAIGCDWPDRIRQACADLMPSSEHADSADTLLLADIKAIFDDMGTDRSSSEQIREALVALEGRPWAEYGNSGKPITKNKLAYRLDRFGIRSENVRIGTAVLKGYHRHRFEEAWARYLTPTTIEPTVETLHRYNTDGADTSSGFQTATPNATGSLHTNETPQADVAVQKSGVASYVAVQKCEERPSHGHCSGVAVSDRGTDEVGVAFSARVANQHKCDRCQQYGETTQIAYDGVEAWLHQECIDAWRVAYDQLDIRNQPFYRAGP
jgi:hypothetical protein